MARWQRAAEEYPRRASAFRSSALRLPTAARKLPRCPLPGTRLVSALMANFARPVRPTTCLRESLVNNRSRLAMRSGGRGSSSSDHVTSKCGQTSLSHHLGGASFCLEPGTGDGEGNPKKRANRHWRCCAYQACRARSRVRLTLVASIVRVLSNLTSEIHQPNLPSPSPGRVRQIKQARLGGALETAPGHTPQVWQISGREQVGLRDPHCSC